MAKKILVVLDPGHYPNYNRGAVSGYYEGNRMYDLSEYEKTALESYGIDVIITRARNSDMSLYARGQVAVKKAKGYDEVVFISNHSNAFNHSACGVCAFRSKYLPESTALGQALVEAIVDVMRPTTGITYSRGVLTRLGSGGADYYGVIRGSVSSAKNITQAAKGPVGYSYLIEHGFHDNEIECKFLHNDANLKKIAEAEAAVIAKYFGMTKVESDETETAPTPKKELYRVRMSWKDVKSQLGAFASLTNAKMLADKNPGYGVYNASGELVYPKAASKTLDEIAKEVINGRWDVGKARKEKLTAAGYDYDAVQARVNEILR